MTFTVNLRKWHLFAALTLVFVLLTAEQCNNADTQRAAEQGAALKEAVSQVGMPAIINYQEMRMAKDILELRDKAISTYAYLEDVNGTLRCFGEGIGFPLPYAVQYTNPVNPAYISQAYPQAEPNGLFMPDSAEASWYMLKGPDGKATAVYVEPRMIVSQFQLPCKTLDAE